MPLLLGLRVRRSGVPPDLLTRLKPIVLIRRVGGLQLKIHFRGYYGRRWHITNQRDRLWQASYIKVRFCLSLKWAVYILVCSNGLQLTTPTPAASAELPKGQASLALLMRDLVISYN